LAEISVSDLALTLDTVEHCLDLAEATLAAVPRPRQAGENFTATTIGKRSQRRKKRKKKRK